MGVPDKGLSVEQEGVYRCFWGAEPEIYRRYHDEEWGRPVGDDRRLFEKICLEGFQAGLSWLTIFRKRENFRQAFDDFDFRKVAKYGEQEINRLLQDSGIVRHRGKIEAAINNASRACALAEEFGSLADYFWQFVPPDEERPKVLDWRTLQAMGQTPTSKRLSKELKKRGWKFVGPTTAYAFMQAMGLVNDHIEGCWAREVVERERKDFLKCPLKFPV